MTTMNERAIVDKLIHTYGYDEPGAQELFDSLRAIGLTVTDDPCIAKLKDGEPFFVLRGQDETAAAAVTYWRLSAIHQYDRQGKPISDATTAKLDAAEGTSEAMARWAAEEFGKLPD